MLIGLLVIGGVLFLAAPAVVPIITPGFSGQQLDLTVELTRIMLLSPLFLALGSVATSILNAQDRFAAAAMAPVVYNLAIIGGAVFLAPSMGVHALAIGVVAGSVLHLLVQLSSLRSGGFRYRPVLETHDPEAREALVLMAPRAIGLGVSQLTFLVSTSLASGLATGSITAFNVAFTILQIPIGVIGVPLGVVVFPSMSRDLARGATDEFLRLLTQSLRLLLFVMLPITALAIVLRYQVVAILFGYGLFQGAAIELTADTLLFFLLGLAAHSAIAVLARAFYAGRDTKTPVAAAIMAVAINVTLGILLVDRMGLGGLAIAIAFGAWAEALVLLEILRVRQPDLDVSGIVRAFLEAFAGSLAAGLAAWVVLQGLGGIFGANPGKIAMLIEVVIAGGLGSLVYVGAAAALRVPELPTIVAVVSDLLRRPARPVRPVPPVPPLPPTRPHAT
jgi:putative peptidoglycan lipid II flippase